jgi:hypothetical protein
MVWGRFRQKAWGPIWKIIYSKIFWKMVDHLPCFGPEFKILGLAKKRVFIIILFFQCFILLLLFWSFEWVIIKLLCLIIHDIHLIFG